MKFFLFFILINSFFILISCGNDTNSFNTEPCKDNPCAKSLIPHKTVCEPLNNDYTCICEEGYEISGKICKKIIIDLCENKNCQANSECKILNEEAQCICNTGYQLENNICKKIEDNSSSFYKIWSDNIYPENAGISLTIDKDQNIYIAGYTLGKMVWDENLQKNIPTTADTTIRKYSPKGDLIWQKVWHDETYDIPVAIVSDKNGNIFIAGETGVDDFRVFLIKIDKDGNKKWTKEWSCENGLFVWDLAIDNDDKLYITGTTYSHFNNTTSKGGVNDSFLIKAESTTGKEIWLKQWGTERMDVGKAIFIKNNEIFVLNENNGDSDIDDSLGAVKWDFNITKFDKSGNIVSDTNWFKGVIDTYVVDFLIDEYDNFYIIGDSPKDFDGHINTGDNDIFVVKLNKNYTKQWSKLIGTPYYDTANSIAIDTERNIFLGGHTRGSFPGFTNPGEGIESDILLIKFKNDSEIDWYKVYSSENRLAGESITKLIIKNDSLFFTGVEDSDYIEDSQNIKSTGYLRKLIKNDYKNF